MFGFRRQQQPSHEGPQISARYCTGRFNGRYAHVGLYDTRERKVWICRPVGGQAIRTSHARLITCADNAAGTVWKDRFVCYWFYTPHTGEGLVHGYPIDWDEGHLLVRIDPQWDYDRQALIPPQLTDHVEANLQRQFRHGDRIFAFYAGSRLKYPFSIHFIGPRATDSLFYVKRHPGAA
jgi:hypothetical protein